MSYPLFYSAIWCRSVASVCVEFQGIYIDVYFIGKHYAILKGKLMKFLSKLISNAISISYTPLARYTFEQIQEFLVHSAKI